MIDFGLLELFLAFYTAEMKRYGIETLETKRANYILGLSCMCKDNYPYSCVTGILHAQHKRDVQRKARLKQDQ